MLLTLKPYTGGDAMADVTLRTEFTLKLTSDEFRLITFGLTGKLKPGSKDAQQAMALGEFLLKQRAMGFTERAQSAQGAVERAKELNQT